MMMSTERDDKGRFKSKLSTALVDKIYGKLKVIKDSGKRQNRAVLWECLCECGKTTCVPTGSLKSGNTKSCGCGQQEHYNKHIHNNATFIDGTEVGLLNPDLMYKHNTSGYRGVSQIKRNGKYRAYIQFKKKEYWLGQFENIEDAIQVRKEAEENIFGEFLKWYEEYKVQKLNSNKVSMIGS